MKTREINVAELKKGNFVVDPLRKNEKIEVADISLEEDFVSIMAKDCDNDVFNVVLKYEDTALLIEDEEEIEECDDWGVIFMPATNGEDPSRNGFKTEEEAKRYTRKHWCKDCRDKYALALKWERNGVDIDEKEREIDQIEYETQEEEWEAYCECNKKYGDFNPACSYEWIVDRTDKTEAVETIDDMMKLVGYKGA